MDATGIVAIVSLFVILPAILIPILGSNAKHKREKDVEKLRYQKEILELEIEKENIHLKQLETENKNLDKLIDVH
jgi:hypothetical protein